MLITRYRQHAISDRVGRLLIDTKSQPLATHRLDQDKYVEASPSTGLAGGPACVVKRALLVPSYGALSTSSAPVETVQQYINSQRQPSRGPGRPSTRAAAR